MCFGVINYVQITKFLALNQSLSHEIKKEQIIVHLK